MPFNFQLLSAPWDARHLAGLIDEYETSCRRRVAELGARQPRPPAHRFARRAGAARVAAMLTRAARRRSTTATRSAWRTSPSPGAGARSSSATCRGWARARPGANADAVERGAERRLRQRRAVAAARRRLAHVNVAAQREDERSMLALYRSLIAPPPRAGARARALPAPARRRRRSFAAPRAPARAELSRRAQLGSRPQRLAQRAAAPWRPRISTARTSAPAASWSCAPTKD